MNLNFIQGIVSTDKSIKSFLKLIGNNVSLIINSLPLILTFSHGEYNYLKTIEKSVLNAWIINPNLDNSWLYADIDVLTANISFGAISNAPTSGDSFPVDPIINHHHYDKISKKLYVFDGYDWINKIRIFLGTINDKQLSQYPLGSQVNMVYQNESNEIYLTSEKLPVHQFDDEGFHFLTKNAISDKYTESTNTLQYSQIKNTGIAGENIQKYKLLSWNSNGHLVNASYTDTFPVIGMSESKILTGNIANFINYGIVKNKSWNLPYVQNVYTPIFVGENGNITTSLSEEYSNQKIGFLLSHNSIFLNISNKIFINPTSEFFE